MAKEIESNQLLLKNIEHVSISAVAEKAGASIATVSRVLNKHPYVNKVTADRILKIATELKYRPNSSGRSLRGGKHFNIGLLRARFAIPDQLYMETMFTNLVRYITLEGYGVSLEFLKEETEKGYLSCPEVVASRKVDGMVIIGHMDQKELEQASTWGIPICLINNKFVHPNFCSSSLDDYSGARDVVQYLAALGHERIGFVYGSLEWPGTRARHQGYIDTMADLGLEVNPHYLVKVDEHQQNYQGGYFATEKLLREVPDLTAIFYINDWYAIGGICAIKAYGKRIPEDISLVGFDNSWMGEEVLPRLTTVSMEAPEICREAASTLIRAVENKPVARPHVNIRPKLFIRDSCAPLREK
ncbi:MAG: LacI family DNA-binding transcriptional regulator [Phycisphaerae bacterium]